MGFKRGRLVGFADDRSVYAGGCCYNPSSTSGAPSSSDGPSGSSDGPSLCAYACDVCGPDPENNTPIAYQVEIEGVGGSACCENLNGVYLLVQDPDSEANSCRWYLDVVSPCNGSVIEMTIDIPFDNVLRLYIQGASGATLLGDYRTTLTILDSGPGFIVLDCHTDVVMDLEACSETGCTCPTTVRITSVHGSLCDGSSSDGSSGSGSGSASASGSGTIDESGVLE